MGFRGHCDHSDLIEPYWNVKMVLCVGHGMVKWRFNRTILECKVRFLLVQRNVISDLIEPYWNVKDKGMNSALLAKLGFNRTILECKGRSWHF